MEKGKPEEHGPTGEEEQIDQYDQIGETDPVKEQYDQLGEQEQLDHVEEKQEQTEEQNPEIEDDAQFEQAMKELHARQEKSDAKLYPEVSIPKWCPLKHPKNKDPKRWASLSPKVKADLYAKFLRYLENWKNGEAGKHAASIYGFDSHTPKPKTILKYLEDDDDNPELAALDASLAEVMAKWNDEDEAP